MEELNQKLNSIFPGKVVRKDLTKKIKEGANVPVYVLEYLLGMYCATDDEKAIEDGVETVKKILSDNFLREQYDKELNKENKQENVNQENRRKKVTRHEANQYEEYTNYGAKEKNHVGSVFGIIDLMKELVKNIKLRKKEKEEFNKKKAVSIILTIVVIIAIGLILWFIPFTNNWIRGFIFNNYIVKFIGGLFS